MPIELPEVPEMALAMAQAYEGIPFLDDDLSEFYDDEYYAPAHPPVPPPTVEGDEPCLAVDDMSGAPCTRGAHVEHDLVHWFDDGGLRIEWREPLQLVVATNSARVTTHADKRKPRRKRR